MQFKVLLLKIQPLLGKGCQSREAARAWVNFEKGGKSQTMAFLALRFSPFILIF